MDFYLSLQTKVSSSELCIALDCINISKWINVHLVSHCAVDGSLHVEELRSMRTPANISLYAIMCRFPVSVTINIQTLLSDIGMEILSSLGD